VIPDISHLHRLKPLFLSLPYPRARRHAVKKDWYLYLDIVKVVRGARECSINSYYDTCGGQSFGARMNQHTYYPTQCPDSDVSMPNHLCSTRTLPSPCETFRIQKASHQSLSIVCGNRAIPSPRPQKLPGGPSFPWYPHYPKWTRQPCLRYCDVSHITCDTCGVLHRQKQPTIFETLTPKLAINPTSFY
jgi:hypothetical protein